MQRDRNTRRQTNKQTMSQPSLVSPRKSDRNLQLQHPPPPENTADTSNSNDPKPVPVGGGGGPVKAAALPKGSRIINKETHTTTAPTSPGTNTSQGPAQTLAPPICCSAGTNGGGYGGRWDEGRGLVDGRRLERAIYNSLRRSSLPLVVINR